MIVSRDHWRTQGARKERARIIKLLSQNNCELDCPNHPAECYPHVHGLDRLIRLIEQDDK